jgi:hypothetical protein
MCCTATEVRRFEWLWHVERTGVTAQGSKDVTGKKTTRRKKERKA